MATPHAWDVGRFYRFNSLTSEPRHERCIVAAAQRRVRFLGRSKIIFHPKMDLHLTARKPATTALRQFGGLRNFCHAQCVDEKTARHVLATGWHRELNVIDLEKRTFSQDLLRLSRLR